MSSYTKIVLLLFAVMMISFILTSVSKVFLFVALASTAAFIIMFFVISRKQKKNAQETKLIKSELISMEYPELKFEADNAIPVNEFFSLGLVKDSEKKYNYVSGGLVSGNINGVSFRAENARVTHVVHHKDSSDTVTDYEGIIAVYNISFNCPHTIKLVASTSLTDDAQQPEMPEFVNKMLYSVVNRFADSEGLPSCDLSSVFNKPAIVYSSDLDYAAEFFDVERVAMLNRIPFKEIIITGNTLVLNLPPDVAEIVYEAESGEKKKVHYIDYNADVDPEKIRRETKTNLDIILSFPDEMRLY